MVLQKNNVRNAWMRPRQRKHWPLIKYDTVYIIRHIVFYIKLISKTNIMVVVLNENNVRCQNHNGSLVVSSVDRALAVKS